MIFENPAPLILKLITMSWKSEAREVKQQHYGGYCLMIRKLGQEPIPYHAFTFEIYDETKALLKAKNL